jgi:hypothetical protein
MGAMPALGVIYFGTEGPNPAEAWGEPWRAVFAEKVGSGGKAAINWVLANRSTAAPVGQRSPIKEGRAQFRLFNGTVADGMDLRVIRLRKEVGDYYRDLFIHKLPGSVTELYLGLMLDGHLLGVVGAHTANMRTGGGGKKKGPATPQPAHITFAFTAPHAGYSRLHKLTLMSFVSGWFWDDTFAAEAGADMLGRPVAVKTTMLTHHPENKTARGVLKQVGREPQKDGTFKLSYEAEVLDRSREETLSLWLKKFGQPGS